MSQTSESKASIIPTIGIEFKLAHNDDASVVPTTSDALASALARTLFTHDRAELHKHAEMIAQNLALRQIYVDIVLASRKVYEDSLRDREVITAASNAISVLNYGSRCGMFPFRFIDVRDWSRIRVPHANLNYAVMAHCNLDDADLSNSSMSSITLCGTQLRRTNLSGIRHAVHGVCRTKSHAFMAIAPTGYLITHPLTLFTATTAIVFNIATEECVGTIPGLTSAARVLNFSQDGELLISLSGTELRIWSMKTFQCITCLQLPDDSAAATPRVCAAFSPDSRYVVTAWDDSMVRIWEIETCQVIKAFQHLDVEGVDWSPRGDQIVSGSLIGDSILVWHVETSTSTVSITRDHQDMRNLQFSSDGSKIFANSKHEISIWDAITGSLITTFTWTSSPLDCLVCDPDGRHIYSSSHDGIQVWDLETKTSINVLRPHPATVNAIKLVMGARYLVSHSRSEHASIVWDVESIKSWQPDISYVSAAPTILSPDGQHLAIAIDRELMQIRSTTTGQCTTIIPRHESAPNNRVSYFFYSLNGQWLAYMLLNHNKMYIWDLTKGCHLPPLEGHSKSIRFAAFSPKQHDLLATCDGSSLRLCDITSQDSTLFCENKDRLEGLEFTSDGSTLAIVVRNASLCSPTSKFVQFWSVTTQECIMTLDILYSTLPHLSYCGRFLAGYVDSDTFGLWYIKTGRLMHSMKTGSVAGLYFHPSGKIISSTRCDNLIRVHDRTLKRCYGIHARHMSFGHKSEMASLSMDGRTFSITPGLATIEIWTFPELPWRSKIAMQAYDPKAPLDIVTTTSLTGASELRGHNGYVIASGSCEDAQIYIHNPATELPDILKGHSEIVTCMQLSLHGGQLVSGSLDATVRVWDLVSKNCMRTYEGHTGAVTCVQLSPDGELIASGSRDTTIRIWSISDAKCNTELEGHTSPVKHLVFSPHQRHLASIGSEDPIIRIWDLTNDACGMCLEAHAQGIFDLQFSADGDYLASGSTDDTVRVWNIKTGECIATLQGHTDCLTCFAFASNGKTIVSGSEDTTVRVWNVATGQCTLILEGHADHIRSLCLTPDNRCVISASDDHVIHIWKLPNGELLHELYGHTHTITSLKLLHYAADGDSILMSTSRDGTIRVWTISRMPSKVNYIPEMQTIIGRQNHMNVVEADFEGAQIDSSFSKAVDHYLE